MVQNMPEIYVKKLCVCTQEPVKKKKKGKKKKEGKKEFKEVLKSHDLDNVFEIQVGGKMRIF